MLDSVCGYWVARIRRAQVIGPDGAAEDAG